MAKLTKIRYEMGGARREAQVSVDSRGVFSIPYPAEVTGASGIKEARANELEACEELFRKGLDDYEKVAKKTEKIIAIRAHSLLFGDSRKAPFADRVTLDIEAQIMLKTSLLVGGETKVTYEEHPDVEGMHKENPIPWAFQLQDFSDFRKGKAQEIPWTQERQDWLVGLLLSLQKICEILGEATKDSDTLIQNMARGLLLGAPPKGKT